MNKLLKLFYSALLFLFMATVSHGQGSTTSFLQGKITDENQQPMAGATIVATHEPSGTAYGANTNSQGLYNIEGMRPGGPYSVEISFVGYARRTFTEIYLMLGEHTTLNADLSQTSTELREVTVIGSRTSKFSTTKTGATTNISGAQMVTLPTVSRNISDITRVSP
jgi:hypothetical protein